MATADGRESRDLEKGDADLFQEKVRVPFVKPLSERLFQEPYAFDFFQAVRILERLARCRAPLTSDSGKAPVGQDHSPEQEAVRFRSQPSLGFPPSAIVQVRSLAQEAAALSKPLPFAEMLVSFMGVTGPTGVLPYHYTALLLRRMRDKDFSLRDFVDLFHHRAISLFYRAWVKYRLPFAYERSKLGGEKEDLITWALYCLAGFGTQGLRNRLGRKGVRTLLPERPEGCFAQKGPDPFSPEVDDEALLFYAGHFAHFPRSALALESILADYFGLPIEVLQLQGQWLQLSPSEQAVMPGLANAKGLHNQLGLNMVVGERVWDQQSKLRIRVGPLTYKQFQRFMPSGDGLRPLCQLTRAFVGPEFDFDVQVVLLQDEVPRCQLGSTAAHKGQLGWNNWMRAREFTYDVDDAVFSSPASVEA